MSTRREGGGIADARQQAADAAGRTVGWALVRFALGCAQILGVSASAVLLFRTGVSVQALLAIISTTAATSISVAIFGHDNPQPGASVGPVRVSRWIFLGVLLGTAALGATWLVASMGKATDRSPEEITALLTSVVPTGSHPVSAPTYLKGRASLSGHGEVEINMSWDDYRRWAQHELGHEWQMSDVQADGFLLSRDIHGDACSVAVRPACTSPHVLLDLVATWKAD